MPKTRGGVVSGVVTDAIGPVAGAAVFVKDGANGVTTDIDGAYTLTDLNLNDVIVISLLGYQTQEIVYTGQTTLNVLLAEESTLLEGVVVTAMGIERQEESLTYAAETVGGDDVNDIKSVFNKTSSNQHEICFQHLFTACYFDHLAIFSLQTHCFYCA